MAKPFTILFGFTLLVSMMFGITSAGFTLPKSIIKKLATRKSRLHHYLWHVTRENWLLLTPEQQQELRDVGWGVERPALRYEEGNPNGIAITDNNSGRDFLYMHKKMIDELNDMLKAEGLPKLKGWSRIPAPGDKDFPVPPAYEIPGDPGFRIMLDELKSDPLYGVMKGMEDQFTNYDELRKLSLGEMGAMVEFGVHVLMHLRFSDASPVGYRARITAENMLDPIEKKWDEVEYNWLADTYSSHVFPNFWMLHYWVNERIEDWKKAHGVKCINWEGSWTGGPMACMPGLKAEKASKNKFLGTDEDDDDDETMERVIRVFNKAGLNDGRFNTNCIDRTKMKVEVGKEMGKVKGKGKGK